MNAGIRLILLAVAAASAATGVAIGQVGPSNPGRRGANYQVGGGRYHRPVGSRWGFNSQLYVTGQVTGLGGFHGNVGYYAANELRLDLPSSSLSAFRRRSVGLSQVLAGRTYQTSAYYDPARTVLGTRGIASGAATPGGNMPRISSVPSATTRRLYTDVLSRYEPILPPGSRTAPIGRSPVTSAMVGASRYRDARDTDRLRWTHSGSAALFGVPRSEDRDQLTRELSAMRIRDDRVEALVDARVEALVDDRVDTLATRRRKGAEAEERPARLPRRLRTPQPEHRREEQIESPADRRLPEPDQDVFLDVLLKLKERRRAAEETDETEIRSKEPRDRTATRAPGRTPRHGKLVGAAGSAVIIRGLAGNSADRFNLYMKQAEKKLKEGKFYAAAGQYELALITDFNNPLARVGLALAMFGAGEPIAAGSNVRRALGMFPALMETRVDILSLMDAGTFSRRLDWLEKRIDSTSAKRADVLMLLMASFAHHNAGNSAKASKYAAMLLAAADKDRILSAYAKSILTPEKPSQPEPATSRPAATAPRTRPSE